MLAAQMHPSAGQTKKIKVGPSKVWLYIPAMYWLGGVELVDLFSHQSILSPFSTIGPGPRMRHRWSLGRM